MSVLFPPVETGTEFWPAGGQACVPDLCGHSTALWATGWDSHTVEDRPEGCWLWTKMGPSGPAGLARSAHQASGWSTEEHRRSPCQPQRWPRRCQKHTAAPTWHSVGQPWTVRYEILQMKHEDHYVKWALHLYKANKKSLLKSFCLIKNTQVWSVFLWVSHHLGPGWNIWY